MARGIVDRTVQQFDVFELVSATKNEHLYRGVRCFWSAGSPEAVQVEMQT